MNLGLVVDRILPGIELLKLQELESASLYTRNAVS